MSQLCHCGSQKSYETCCEPYILGKKNAPTAEALMRSRYSAYVVVATDYLIQTTHTSTRSNFSATEIENWAKTSEWEKLELISRMWGGAENKKGEVEFKAHYLDKNKNEVVHHELSYFAQETDGKWYYISGKIDPSPKDVDASLEKLRTQVTPSDPNKKIGRNDPCPCGSGKKHKKCCG